jgi:hypothetical protein
MKSFQENISCTLFHISSFCLSTTNRLPDFKHHVHLPDYIIILSNQNNLPCGTQLFLPFLPLSLSPFPLSPFPVTRYPLPVPRSPLPFRRLSPFAAFHRLAPCPLPLSFNPVPYPLPLPLLIRIQSLTLILSGATAG